jgi:hypothetical protein
MDVDLEKFKGTSSDEKSLVTHKRGDFSHGTSVGKVPNKKCPPISGVLAATRWRLGGLDQTILDFSTENLPGGVGFLRQLGISPGFYLSQVVSEEKEGGG